MQNDSFCSCNQGTLIVISMDWGRILGGGWAAGGISWGSGLGLSPAGPSIWPPRKSVNWVLFVPFQIQSSEEGLLYTQDLASTYGDVCCWWVGPWHAVIRIFHPTYIKPVLFSSGRHPMVMACSQLRSLCCFQFDL